MATKKTAPALTIAGSPPPPLPEVEPALAPLRDELAAIEALALTEPRPAQLRADELEQRTLDTDLAQRLLRALPRDFGEVPANPDYSAAKTVPQRKKLEAAFSALIQARHARERTFGVLHAIAARDLDFQARAFATLDEWTGGSPMLRGTVFGALLRAPSLYPPLAEHVRRVAVEKPPTQETGPAIFAAFRQGWVEELIWPAVEQRSTLADYEHAKLVIGIGLGYGFFAREPERWRPRLEELQKLADQQYDFAKGEEARASLQLGLGARHALASLTSAPKGAPAPPKKQPTRATLATPVDRKKLKTPKEREAALDALGGWIVEQLVDADDAKAREVIASAIATFYDVRQAAGQEREEYAGHFFMADGVGLDDTGRPVPWTVLRERVGDARVDALRELFLEVEKAIR